MICSAASSVARRMRTTERVLVPGAHELAFGIEAGDPGFRAANRIERCAYQSKAAALPHPACQATGDDSDKDDQEHTPLDR